MPKKAVLPIILSLLSFSLFVPLLAAEANNPSDASLRVEKAVICRGVDQRTPIGVANVFTSDAGRLFCFTRVTGAGAETTITHRWYLNGELKSSVGLPVKSASWRTWSEKRIHPTDIGDWMVEIVSEDGTALATILFFIQ